MRRPSKRLLPNTVRVRLVDFGRDAGLGRQAAERPPGPPIACAVQPTGLDVKPAHERQQGVLYLTVKFYDDPGLAFRDELVDELGRLLVVQGVRGSGGGAGRSWPVDCEYTPATGERS